jgi:hypothetical protein
LTTINRDSGDKGETWSTSIENDVILLPFFRSDPNGSVDLDIVFSSTRDYDASFAGKSLDVIKRASDLLSPQGKLITSLDKDAFNQAATFVDGTLNGLLRIAINEEAHLNWSMSDQRDEVATLTLYASGANDPFWGDPTPVGSWKITLEPMAGESIFALRQDADGKLSNDLSAASVLNFEVAEGRSLRDALNAEPSVQGARDHLMSVEAKDAGDAGLILCRNVAIAADRLGFAPNDVGHAVWAYLSHLALPTKKADAEKRCRALDHWPSQT